MLDVEGGDHVDAGVEELHLVHGHYLRRRLQLLRDLPRRIDWGRLQVTTVVAGDVVQPGIAVVEMALEHVDALAGDGRPPHTSHQLLALAAEHHSGDHLDPAAGGCDEAIAQLLGPFAARRLAGIAQALGTLGKIVAFRPRT